MQGSSPPSLSQDLPPLPSPQCLFIHARNVNSHRAVKKTLSLCLAISPATLFSNSERDPPLHSQRHIFPVCFSVLAEEVAAQS